MDTVHVEEHNTTPVQTTPKKFWSLIITGPMEWTESEMDTLNNHIEHEADMETRGSEVHITFDSEMHVTVAYDALQGTFGADGDAYTVKRANRNSIPVQISSNAPKNPTPSKDKDTLDKTAHTAKSSTSILDTVDARVDVAMQKHMTGINATFEKINSTLDNIQSTQAQQAETQKKQTNVWDAVYSQLVAKKILDSPASAPPAIPPIASVPPATGTFAIPLRPSPRHTAQTDTSRIWPRLRMYHLEQYPALPAF